MERLNEHGNPTKGWGPWRYDWYTICSKAYNPDCKTCKVGRWVNKWWKACDSYIYHKHYRWWFWWHNGPESASRRHLETIFPNLRNPKP